MASQCIQPEELWAVVKPPSANGRGRWGHPWQLHTLTGCSFCFCVHLTYVEWLLYKAQLLSWPQKAKSKFMPWNKTDKKQSFHGTLWHSLRMLPILIDFILCLLSYQDYYYMRLSLTGISPTMATGDIPSQMRCCFSQRELGDHGCPLRREVRLARAFAVAFHSFSGEMGSLQGHLENFSWHIISLYRKRDS